MRRRWQGNLVPLAVALPFLVAGLAMVRPDDLARPVPLVLLALFPTVGWIALNALASRGDAAMRAVLERRLSRRFPAPVVAGPWFVGFARPSYVSALDPHEDLGFLFVTADAVVFVGETQRVELPRGSILRVGRRANPHTWLGLGGWVTLEGEVEGKPVRMMVEPRERRTLRGNVAAAHALRTTLTEQISASPAKAGDAESPVKVD